MLAYTLTDSRMLGSTCCRQALCHTAVLSSAAGEQACGVSEGGT